MRPRRRGRARRRYFLATMAFGSGRRAVGMGLALAGVVSGSSCYWWPVLVVMADLPNAFPDSRFVSTIGLATFVFGLILYRADGALVSDRDGCSRDASPGSTSSFADTSHRSIQNVVNMLFWDHAGLPVLPAAARTDVRSTSVRRRSPSTRGTRPGAIFIMAILPIGLYVLYRAYATASVGDATLDRADRSLTATVHHLHVLGLPLLPRHGQVLGSASLCRGC